MASLSPLGRSAMSISTKGPIDSGASYPMEDDSPPTMSPSRPVHYLAELAQRWDLDNITQADLDNFNHFTSSHKEFLLVFLTRWRNNSLSKTKRIMQRGFNAVREHAKRHKYELDRVKRATEESEGMLAVASLKRSPEQINAAFSWLKNMRVNGDNKHPLTDEQTKVLAETAVLRTCRPGELLFLQGQKGTEYYVLIKGKVELHMTRGTTELLKAKERWRKCEQEEKREKREQQHDNDNDNDKDKAKDKDKDGPPKGGRNMLIGLSADEISAIIGPRFVEIKRSYSGFGELSLLDNTGNTTRTLSAVCLPSERPSEHPCILLVIPSNTFDKTYRERNASRHDTINKVKDLLSIPPFSNWSPHQLQHAAFEMRLRNMSIHDVIARQGHRLDSVYIITEGTVAVRYKAILREGVLQGQGSGGSASLEAEIGREGRGSILGVGEVIDGVGGWDETLKVVSARCKVLEIDREAFERIILSAPGTGDVIRENWKVVAEWREGRRKEVVEREKEKRRANNTSAYHKQQSKTEKMLRRKFSSRERRTKVRSFDTAVQLRTLISPAGSPENSANEKQHLPSIQQPSRNPRSLKSKSFSTTLLSSKFNENGRENDEKGADGRVGVRRKKFTASMVGSGSRSHAELPGGLGPRPQGGGRLIRRKSIDKLTDIVKQSAAPSKDRIGNRGSSNKDDIVKIGLQALRDLD